MPINQADRDRIEDLGLDPGADNTPDMRMTPVAADAIQKNHHAVTTTTESEF